MSDSPLNPEKNKIQRASERKRAYRLGKRDATTLSKEDSEWLAEYHRTKRGGGKAEPADAEPDDAPDDTTVPVTPTSHPTEDAEPAMDAPVIDAPPPPPPPRVAVGGKRGDDEESTESGNWKRKYRSGSMGREATVLHVANQWGGILKFLNAQIKASGATPMINVDDIHAALVLTVDDMLPERVSIKPVHVAAIGTTVILAQRVYNHKKIVEAYNNATTESPAPEYSDLPTRDTVVDAGGSKDDTPVAADNGTAVQTSDVANGTTFAPPLITLAPNTATTEIIDKAQVF